DPPHHAWSPPLRSGRPARATRPCVLDVLCVERRNAHREQAAWRLYQAEPEKRCAGGFSPKPTPLVRLSSDLLRFFDGERPGARCDQMQVVSACGNRPELVRLLPVARHARVSAKFILHAGCSLAEQLPQER